MRMGISACNGETATAKPGSLSGTMRCDSIAVEQILRLARSMRPVLYAGHAGWRWRAQLRPCGAGMRAGCITAPDGDNTAQASQGDEGQYDHAQVRRDELPAQPAAHAPQQRDHGPRTNRAPKKEDGHTEGIGDGCTDERAVKPTPGPSYPIGDQQGHGRGRTRHNATRISPATRRRCRPAAAPL